MRVKARWFWAVLRVFVPLITVCRINIPVAQCADCSTVNQFIWLPWDPVGKCCLGFEIGVPRHTGVFVLLKLAILWQSQLAVSVIVFRFNSIFFVTETFHHNWMWLPSARMPRRPWGHTLRRWGSLRIPHNQRQINDRFLLQSNDNRPFQQTIDWLELSPSIDSIAWMLWAGIFHSRLNGIQSRRWVCVASGGWMGRVEESSGPHFGGE